MQEFCTSLHKICILSILAHFKVIWDNITLMNFFIQNINSNQFQQFRAEIC